MPIGLECGRELLFPKKESEKYEPPPGGHVHRLMQQ
jgi:hypothetical protein